MQNICHFAHTHVGADSQKQYWEIKQKYRDVILFFKIGTFYELYEGDAQIGHDILGWKMTITGVGHCRQVTLAVNDMLAQSLRFDILVSCAVVSFHHKQTMQPTQVANRGHQWTCHSYRWAAQKPELMRM